MRHSGRMNESNVRKEDWRLHGFKARGRTQSFLLNTLIQPGLPYGFIKRFRHALPAYLVGMQIDRQRAY